MTLRQSTSYAILHVSNLGASLAEVRGVAASPVLVTANLEHVREHGSSGEEVQDVQSREAEAESLGSGTGGAGLTSLTLESRFDLLLHDFCALWWCQDVFLSRRETQFPSYPATTTGLAARARTARYCQRNSRYFLG